MINFRWLGVLNVDRDITLTTTVDLAAGSGQPHSVGHFFLHELVIEIVHHGLDDTGGVDGRGVTFRSDASIPRVGRPRCR